MYCPECGNKNKPSAKFCIKCGASLIDLGSEKKVDQQKDIEAGFILDDRYKIIDIIERGGMGAVYKAKDQRLNINLAIKEMRENFERDEYRIYAIEKFKSEALILSKLRHPNIPRVSDYFIQNNRYYLAMDYIDGETLFKIVNRRPNKKVTERELVRWTLQLCDVLSYLHHQDPPIIYRDLKPANIMITPEERVFLIDFGIARIFNPKSRGTMIGTQGYSPPEQYRGRVDPRSDIYALGATMHHLVTGRDPQLDAPFSFPPVKDLVKGVGDTVSFVIEKCLKFNMDERFTSIDEMRDVLAKEATGILATIYQAELKQREHKPDKELTEIRKKQSVSLTSELESLLNEVEPQIDEEVEEFEGDDEAKPQAISKPEPEPEKIPRAVKHGVKPIPIVSSIKKEKPDDKEEKTGKEQKKPAEEMKPEVKKRPLKIDESSRASALFEKLKSGSLKSGSLKKKNEKEEARQKEAPLERKKKSSEKADKGRRRFPTVPFGPIEINIPKIKPRPKPKAEPKPKPAVKPEPPPQSVQPEKPTPLAPFPEEPLEPEEPEKRKITEDFLNMDEPKDIRIDREPELEISVEQKSEEFTIPAMVGAGQAVSQIVTQSHEEQIDTNVMPRARDTADIPSNTSHLVEGESRRGKLPPKRKIWNMFRGMSSHEGRNQNAPDCKGQLKWRIRTNGRIYSSPTMDHRGNIYIGSNDGCLYCINKNGKEKWRYLTDGSIYSTPLIVPGDGIYLGSEDHNFYCIDFNGKGKWRKQMGDVILSSPVISYRGAIVVGCNDGNIYCFDPTGKERWRFTIDNFIYSSPAIGPEGTIYVGAWDKCLYAISPGGVMEWKFETGGIVDSSPAVDGAGCIYFGSNDGHFYSLDHKGRLKWKFRTGDKIYSSPAIHPHNGVYFGSYDNFFYNLDFYGRVSWKFRTDYWVKSSPALDKDGNVYFGGEDFTVYCLRKDGSLAWSFKTNGSVESCPCLDNHGTLYIGSHDGWLYVLE